MFWHKLALAIGGCTIKELQARMTAHEADQWRRFLRICGPAGYDRDEYYYAMIASLIVNVNSSPEHQRPLNDFILKPRKYFGLRAAANSVMKMLENSDKDIEALAARFGKKPDRT